MGQKLSSDFSLIWDPACRQHPAWSAFLSAMANRAYGREAINGAWVWFSKGWDAVGPHAGPTIVVQSNAIGVDLDADLCSLCDHTRAWHREHSPRHPFVGK